MPEHDKQCDLTELFLLALQGDITPEQMKQFSLMLSTDPARIRDYVELMRIYTELSSAGSVAVPDKADDVAEKHDALLHLLANEENIAPEIEVPQKEPQHELIQKVDRQKIVRKINKSSLFSLITAAAAIVLIFVFAHFAPDATGFKVAILQDMIDARWSNTDIAMEKGLSLFSSNNKLVLCEGYAKLLFDNKVQVTIEGPAEFQILAEDKLHINYGRAYAIVPHEAIGFMVTSRNAKVIDLGTEFGMEVNPAGDTSLHVIKGRTTLIAGDKSNKQSMDVIQGLAKRVSATLQDVKDISCNERLFARDIDSTNEIIWRGEVQAERNYIDWTAKSGTWSNNADWNTGTKPDGTCNIRLRNKGSICVLNTAEKPVSSQLTVSNGQILNIENGGFIGCGWSRFGNSTVNMTGNGTWFLNDDDLYIGYPLKDNGNCVWTMSDTSRITVKSAADDGETLYISQDNAEGILKLVGSNVTVICDQLYVGYPRNPGFSPYATLEYVLDGSGVSTIHAGGRIYLSEGTATSHLVVSAGEPLPKKDLVLIEIKSNESIAGDGVFDTLNGGPGLEGTVVSMGSNRYRLTYQYEANSDGNRNDIALVYEEDPQP